MNTSRKILSGITAIIVTIAVFLLGVSLAVTGALSSAQPVKDALASSEVYEEFVGEAVDDIPGSLAGMISYEPELRDVVVEAAIPSMKEDTEEGIDGLLAWLQGSSDEINFKVEAAGAQEPVSKAVGNYVQELIEGMDECVFVTPNFNTNNPFIWECKLPNTDVETYNTAFYEIVKDQDFWAETSYDLNDVIGISEQELKEDYQMYAAIYPSAVATAWISAIVIVLGTVAIWFLTRTVRRTLRPIGISFIVGGVLLIGAYIAGVIGLGIAAEEFGSSDPLEAVTAEIVTGLGGVAVAWLLWSGIVAIVLGIVAIVVSFIVGKNGQTNTTSSGSVSETLPTDTPQNPLPPTPMQ